MASASLTRTPSSNGNRQVFTFSMWLKRSKLGSTQYFLSQGSDNDNNFAISFFVSSSNSNTFVVFWCFCNWITYSI